ncbi:MAG: HupE/UreJ family protein, partial [Bacteroidetes bacterium]|nr:HupE/UreJ family protein [Bacteroidota bacterium]
MNEFTLYFTLGLEHVLDMQAYDHMLFLVALCASYSLGSWKRLFLLVSLFTLGHTASLYLASRGWFPISSEWIEILIPITILLTAVYSFWSAYKSNSIGNEKVLYVVTLLFGFIHGFGFGRYFIQINDEGE